MQKHAHAHTHTRTRVSLGRTHPGSTTAAGLPHQHRRHPAGAAARQRAQLPEVVCDNVSMAHSKGVAMGGKARKYEAPQSICPVGGSPSFTPLPSSFFCVFFHFSFSIYFHSYTIHLPYSNSFTFQGPYHRAAESRVAAASAGGAAQPSAATSAASQAADVSAPSRPLPPAARPLRPAP